MKYLIIRIVKVILKAFFIFPIKKNRIVFSAYSGKNYSCNPKYICSNLLGRDNGFEIIWAFIDPEHFKDLDKKIRRVKYKSIKYLYYTITACVVVDNVEGWSVLPPRKNQTVINTWHGGGAYKGVGMLRRDANQLQNKNMVDKHRRVTLYLSSSRTFTEQTIRQSFLYSGEVIECGMPRNDIIIKNNNTDIKELKIRYGFDPGFNYVLYAPTFRAGSYSHEELDIKRLLEALEGRFSGDWKLLYRSHYYISGNSLDLAENDRIADVTDYPDMQELLLVADVLLTDYSSSIWDYSFLERPGFLFVPDLKYYENERAFYSPLDEWPFEYAETMDQLCSIIGDFDPDRSSERIRKHHALLGNCESGNASEIIADRIIDTISTK